MDPVTNSPGVSQRTQLPKRIRIFSKVVKLPSKTFGKIFVFFLRNFKVFLSSGKIFPPSGRLRAGR
jgi:hypothetical protein